MAMDFKESHLIRYFQNELPDSERLALERSMEESVDLKNEVDNFRKIWIASKMKHIVPIDVDRNWNELESKIEKGENKKRVNIFTLLRNTAAILTIPLLCGLAYSYYSKDEALREYTQYVEVQSAYGLISKLTLSDGSKVWLNSGSKLKYPRHFTGDKRTVYLEGEAYFDVESDKENRFDVITQKSLTISAFGTEFNVKSYADENIEEVVLISGNVDLYMDRAEKKTLNKGQIVTFNRETREKDNSRTTASDSNNRIVSDIDTVSANVYMKTAWKDGMLILRRTTFPEIAQILSRKFNAEVILKDKELYQYEYSATFSNESLDEILALLQKTTPIKMEVHNPVIQDDMSFSRKKIIISYK